MCIQKHNEENSKCPICGIKEFNFRELQGHKNMLLQQEVFCAHEGKGCTWRGKLSDLDAHLRSDNGDGCGFTLLERPVCHERRERSSFTKTLKATNFDVFTSFQMPVDPC